ncbi:MAG: type II secretion system protein [Desulfobacterales bacterium]|nr:type II secretion system protein [Desulfobacterales bacterium]
MRLIIRNNRGFTWIELLVVMVILAIISAVVAGSLMSSDTELIARTEVIKTHLRYAQTRSMNSNTVWYIQLSGNSYFLSKKGDGNPILLPGGDSPTITLPSGMSVTSGTVSFDGLGKPCTDADAQIAQAADRTLTVTDGSGSRSIIITKNTGFIQ